MLGNIYLYIWLVLFGVCIGSFLNVVVYRLPKGIFFSKSRSYCPVCKESLKWYDLIPVFSFIILKGRCRYCNMRISLRYIVIEIISALLAMLCFIRFGVDFRFLLSFAMLAILLAIAYIDFDTMEIPNVLVLALIPFAISALWFWNDISLVERVIGFFAISFPMLVLALFINGAFGGGDIKLIAVCGFLLGWKNVLIAFFISLILGGCYAIYLLMKGKVKRDEHIAFGPHLCVGIAVAFFFGTEIIQWYLSLFV